MSQDGQERKGAGSLWAEWTKSAMDFWQSAAKTWPGMSTISGKGSEGESDSYWQTPLEVWKNFLSTWANPENLQSAKGVSALADSTLSGARAVCDGCLSLHQEWLKWLGKIGESGKPQGLNKLQPELFKTWAEFHEKEIQPFLKIPQVGLTRIYQEKFNQVVDKFNVYQAVAAEFQCMLYLPMEKSLHVLQEKLDQLTKNGSPPEDFKDYYGVWIKILEEHYMNLFKSQEYRESLGKLLSETAEFRMTGHDLMIDLLQILPIPTNKDMDEVYKDLYTIKKLVKEMKKRVEALEVSTQQD